MKKKEIAFSNTKIAIVFFVFLAFIIGISLIFKLAILLKNGQFTNSRSFILSIANGKNIEVVSLSPDLRNIAVFKFDGRVSSVDAGRHLGIPIDGFIDFDSLDLDQKINSLLFKAIVNYDKLKTNLTVIDLLGIAMFTRVIPEGSVDTIAVEDVGKMTLDKTVGNSMRDTSIENDNQTIRIVNATDISGLGNRLARLITNMGGDVLIVATENSPRKKSSISYIDKKTYTVERLRKVLGYEVIKDVGNLMSDITIIIGEDGVDTAPF